jgi:hypothetical protein
MTLEKPINLDGEPIAAAANALQAWTKDRH